MLYELRSAGPRVMPNFSCIMHQGGPKGPSQEDINKKIVEIYNELHKATKAISAAKREIKRLEAIQ